MKKRSECEITFEEDTVEASAARTQAIAAKNDDEGFSEPEFVERGRISGVGLASLVLLVILVVAALMFGRCCG